VFAVVSPAAAHLRWDKYCFTFELTESTLQRCAEKVAGQGSNSLKP
jgi:hypothetical protein